MFSALRLWCRVRDAQGERPGCAREGFVNMDADALCIICNWVNDGFWPYGGLGGLGAAAAAAAAGGFFGGGGFSGAGAGGGSDDSGSDPRNYDRDPNADDVGDVTPRPPPARAPALTNFDNWLRDFTQGINNQTGGFTGEDRAPLWRGGTTRN